MAEELPNEFEMIATFISWIKILPVLKENGYKRIEYYSKSDKIGYFKKDN